MEYNILPVFLTTLIEEPPVAEAEAEAPAAAEEPAPKRLEARAGDLAVIGTLDGIEDYVLAPAPATGAGQRLRARAFRVSVMSQLIRERIQKLAGGLQTISSTPGHFVLAGPATPDEESALARFQKELDPWAFAHPCLRGEIECHVVWARCDSATLPSDALDRALSQRRRRPFQDALLNGGRWDTSVFYTAPAEEQGVCPGCGRTATLGAELCPACWDDEKLGHKLAHSKFWMLASGEEADVSGPGTGLRLSDTEGVELAAGDWPLPRHTLDFEELAARAPGRQKLLGYLTAEADGAADLQRGLADFPEVVPVFGGVGHLLAAGPWDQALRFALKLREGGPSPLSAGIALAAPHRNMRAAAQDSRDALALARKAGGDRLAFGGTSLTWDEAQRLAESSFRIAGWMASGEIAGETLRRILDIHRASRKPGGGWTLRHLPLLAYESQKAKDPGVRKWIQKLGGSAEWLRMDLVAWLALLAGENHGGGRNG